MRKPIDKTKKADSNERNLGSKIQEDEKVSQFDEML